MHCQIGNFWTRLILVPVRSAGSQSPLEALFLLPLPRTRSEPLSRALQSFQETSAGPLRKDFRFPGLRKNRFSLEMCSKIHTFAISAPAASSEVQKAAKGSPRRSRSSPKRSQGRPGRTQEPPRDLPEASPERSAAPPQAHRRSEGRFEALLRPPRRLLELSATPLGPCRLAFGVSLD